MKTLYKFCPNCKEATTHIQPDVGHGWWLLGSLLTGGLLVIPWIIIAVLAHRKNTCQVCGVVNP